MAFLSIDIEFSAASAPKLKELLDSINFTDKVEFFDSLVDDFEILTREHITKASQTRHKSAARLGASPTGYLEKIATAAEGVRGAASPGRVRLTLQGEIFKRAFGDVTVTKDKKRLTIPLNAASYARRAPEFTGLFPIKSKRGNLFLVRRGEGKLLEFMYLLRDRVLLPQDRGLLPSEAEYLRAVEIAAQRYVDAEVAKARH